MNFKDKKVYYDDNGIVVFEDILFNPLENGFDLKFQYVKLVDYSRRQRNRYTTRNHKGIMVIKSNQIQSLKGLSIDEAQQYIIKYWIDFFKYLTDPRYKNVISVQKQDSPLDGMWGFWDSEQELREALGLENCPISVISAYS